MQQELSSLVSDVRLASRNLVREFGFMNKTMAGTDLSASAVHAIIEIGRSEGLSASALCELLLLEKSTVSRLVKSLLERQEITERRSKQDTRIKYLYLTDKGRKTLRVIDHYAEKQVSAALSQLSTSSQQCVLKGLQQYSTALRASSSQSEFNPSNHIINIKKGYTPTILGRIIELMHAHMNQQYGFGRKFETRITGDIAEFFSRIDSPQNETWRAETGGRIIGSISIDGEDLDEGIAHLRWFIVSNTMRGAGVGESLLTRALDFCDKHGFEQTHLWTVKGLDAARKLYEKHGFVLAEEYFGDQWGTNILEQKFVRQSLQKITPY